MNVAAEATYGSAIRVGAEVLIRTLSIVATLTLTRRLGVVGFGEFIAAMSVAVLVAELADFGINQAMIPELVRKGMSLYDAARAKVCLTLGVGISVFGVAPFLSRYTAFDVRVVLLCLIHFLGVGWVEWAGAGLRAYGQRVSEGILLLVFRLSLVSLVLLAPLGQSPRRAALAYAVSIVPGLALGSYLCAPYLRDKKGASVATVLRGALPMGLNGYLSIVAVRVEIFALRLWGSPVSLGLFAGALRILESLMTLPAALAAGALPALSREHTQNSTSAATRTLGTIVWLGVPMAAGIFTKAPAVLGVLGPGFVDGAPALRIVTVALLVCFINTGLFHLLIAQERARLVPILTGGRLLAGILLATVLVPRFLETGAALSFTIVESMLLFGLLATTTSGIRAALLRALASSSCAAAVMLVALSAGPSPLVFAIPIGALAFAAAGGVLIRWRPRFAGLA